MYGFHTDLKLDSSFLSRCLITDVLLLIRSSDFLSFNKKLNVFYLGVKLKFLVCVVTSTMYKMYTFNLSDVP